MKVCLHFLVGFGHRSRFVIRIGGARTGGDIVIGSPLADTLVGEFGGTRVIFDDGDRETTITLHGVSTTDTIGINRSGLNP